MDATKSEEATLCRRRGGRATRLLAGLLAALLLCANAPVARGEDEADEGGGMPPEWGAAIDAYTRDPVANRDRVLAIERDPGGQLPPQVQVIIADAYLRGGQAAAAERILRDALASGPQYPWDIFAKLGLGSARLMQGDATGAQQYFADVAAAPQESSRLFGELGLGHAYLANDQPEEAKAAFDAAATNKAVDSQFRQAGQFGSAASLYAAGDYEGAAKAFDALADSDPKSKIALDARYAAARARLAAGDRDAAKRALEGMESRCASVKTAGRAPRSLRNLDARALRRAWLRNYQQSSWAESMGTDSTMYSIGGCDLARATLRQIQAGKMTGPGFTSARAAGREGGQRVAVASSPAAALAPKAAGASPARAQEEPSGRLLVWGLSAAAIVVVAWLLLRRRARVP